MSHFTVEEFVHDAGYFPDPVLAPSGQSPFKLTAKRYLPKAKIPIANDAFVLIFCHCAGAHKEQWEPVIEKLFIDQAVKSTSLHVREVWSIDWMSHGDSAIENASALQARKYTDIIVSTAEWGAAIANFVQMHNLHTQRTRTIAIGHSAGSAALCHSTAYFPPNEPPYAALVLAETTLLPVVPYLEHKEERDALLQLLTAGILNRRDSWESRDQAHEWLSKRFPWSMWDKRIVKLYTQYGLRDLPDGRVQIKCNKAHEASSYSDFEAHMTAVPHLKRIVFQVPTYFIYGERIDLVPQHIRDPLLESVGRTKESPSVRYVPNAGHLLLQENPDGFTSVLNGIIHELASPLSKL